MLCCKDCSLETDATFTTVLFLDTVAQQRTYALQNYARENLKKMQAKTMKNKQADLMNKENKCGSNRHSNASTDNIVIQKTHQKKKLKNNFLS